MSSSCGACLPTLEARTRLVRVVREWLGIDGVAEIDKDSNVYPSFAAHHNAIAAESVSFIDEVLDATAPARCRSCWARSGRSSTADGATDDEVSAYYTRLLRARRGRDRAARTVLTAAPRAAPASGS